MKTFKKFINEEQLNEKLITFGNRAKYGQVVFLAGGAGSGKGFSLSKFIDSSNFYIRDVDEYKKQWMEYAKLKNKYPEIQNLDLKNPNDVFKLHMFIKGKGFITKKLNLLLSDLQKGRLPNVIFDVTFKDIKSEKKLMQTMIDAGYEANNIHLVWVLQNYHIAVQQNQKRARRVPDDILLQTHIGAANSMFDIIERNSLSRKILDGSVTVILNRPEKTVYWTDEKGNPIMTKSDKPEKVVKDFARIILKKQGKPYISDKKARRQLLHWMIENIPASVKNREIFKKGKKEFGHLK